jgi:hypothetical protein
MTRNYIPVLGQRSRTPRRSLEDDSESGTRLRMSHEQKKATSLYAYFIYSYSLWKCYKCIISSCYGQTKIFIAMFGN